MKTLGEILDQLKQIDEITLLEMLGLSSEDLVERFQDLIENDSERFVNELEQFFGPDDPDEET